MAKTEARPRERFRPELNQILSESFEKENQIYLNWFHQHYEKLREDAFSPVKISPQVHELYKELCELRTKRYQEEPRHVKIKKIPEIPREKPTDVIIMRPASPRTMGILYRGLTNEGDGRKDYLKARNKLYPIDKFFGPVTTSNKIGWFLSKMEASDKSPFGRKTIIEKSFYRKNGVGPSYYSRKPPLSKAPFIIHGI